jgi:hypothetical protein
VQCVCGLGLKKAMPGSLGQRRRVLRIITPGAFGMLAMLAAGCARPSLAQGRTLYRANGCASCHGPDGHGDGPLAPNLPAAPIDFRNVSLFKRGATEDDIAKTLLVGVSLVHVIPILHQTHHELLMPKFDHLTKTERRSIALYVISLRNDSDGGRVHP